MLEESHDSGPRRRSGTLFLLLVVAVALAAGLYLGRRTALLEVASESAADAVSTVSSAELEELHAELAISRTRHEVDRQALEMVRGEMAQQKEQKAALEEDLRFYRNLMEPEAASGKLILSVPVLEAGAQAREIHYRFVILQRAAKHAAVKGSVTVAISGAVAGESATYSLQELAGESGDNSEDAIVLNFRYFQVLEGTMRLPENFEPADITLAASITRPKKSQLREVFPWQVQE